MTGWIHFENQTLIRRATFVGSAVQVALGIRDDPGVRVQAVGWGLEIVTRQKKSWVDSGSGSLPSE